MKILDNTQESILEMERNTLNQLQVLLENFGISKEDLQTLHESIQQADDFFLLVVVGEFNAGKSRLINALLGEPLLKEGVTPTTTAINLIRYGEQPERSGMKNNVNLFFAPVELLKEISIVDTPGTNAIIREHEAITAQFVPRSDLILFITSADRPFTESERLFLEKIHAWGKKIILILNKIDLFETPEDREEVIQFIKDNAQKLLGLTPVIFPVSARDALDAKQGAPEKWNRSQFEALESYITDSLDETGKLKLKLANPIGVGINLACRYTDVIKARLKLLSSDLALITNLEAQIEAYTNEILEDFEYRMTDIEKVLFKMEKRSQTFFNEKMKIFNIFDLTDKKYMRRTFEKEVIADVPSQITLKVDQLIDWMVTRNLQQWHAMSEYLDESRQRLSKSPAAKPSLGNFNLNREMILNTISQKTNTVIEGFDKEQEARKIAEQAQNTVAATAAMEAGAVGLGALITALATTAAADVTGIVLASVMAIIGFLVIPARKKKAIKESNEKISALRIQLIEALREEFTQQIRHSTDQFKSALAPYTRYVRAEHEKLTAFESQITALHATLLTLKTKVEDL
jgi:small GTP-binding protein